ncbi:RDD family protein [Serpentinicella sp. ANB-PHB4]|uniref:RDD family protein n=1 Tax=Serpentinicella sp. ANB-PHB4 TaxID=3074076 RepID=UPI00285979F6|nr:RDD family protein [Serpentinicella sp. ANB-PHB4]MDR5659279.1 RDD family protein [Serpentinicella sp. ANB-PHB4]
MKKTINTNLYHQYPNFFYAGFWMRGFAYIVDMIVVGSLQRILLNPLFTIIPLNNRILGFTPEFVLQAIIFYAYFILMTKLNKGQTLGKMVFGLRVVCFKEESLTWYTVIIRELFGRYLLRTYFFLYITLPFTKKKQHVADLLTDTSVVTENVLLASQMSFRVPPRSVN